jgi:hypothetical protein
MWDRLAARCGRFRQQAFAEKLDRSKSPAVSPCVGLRFRHPVSIILLFFGGNAGAIGVTHGVTKQLRLCRIPHVPLLSLRS